MPLGNPPYQSVKNYKIFIHNELRPPFAPLEQPEIPGWLVRFDDLIQPTLHTTLSDAKAGCISVF